MQVRGRHDPAAAQMLVLPRRHLPCHRRREPQTAEEAESFTAVHASGERASSLCRLRDKFAYEVERGPCCPAPDRLAAAPALEVRGELALRPRRVEVHEADGLLGR